MLGRQLRATNEHIDQINQETPLVAGHSERSKTTKGELLKHLGIHLVFSLEPTRGGFGVHWNLKASADQTCVLAKEYGKRFGMSRNRLEFLQNACLLDVKEDSSIPIQQKVIIYLLKMYLLK